MLLGVNPTYSRIVGWVLIEGIICTVEFHSRYLCNLYNDFLKFFP